MRKIKSRKVIALLLLSSLIALSLPVNAFAGSSGYGEGVEIDFGKEYNMQDFLIYASGDDNEGKFLFKVSPLEKGRMRVWIKNICDLDKLQDDYYIDMLGLNRDWNEKGDVANSGWITVDKGTLEFEFLCYGSLTSSTDAIVSVEFESSRNYNGEMEPNNTFENATPIKPGATYYGDHSKGLKYDEDTDSFIGDFECDCFYFDMVDSGLAKVRVKNEDIKNEYNKDARADYEIYHEKNGKMNLIFSTTDYDYRNVLGLLDEQYLRLPKGRYYIKVKTGFETVFNYLYEYSLSVNCVTDEANDYYEKEFNNSSSSANHIETGEIYTGNFNTINDNDWFQFETDENRIISLEFEAPKLTYYSGAKVTLYDEEFNEIQTIITSEDLYYKTEDKIMSAGIYYVKVEPYEDGLDSMSDYMLRVNSDIVLDPVTNINVEYAKYNKVKLTWDATEGADGYVIYSRKGTSNSLSKRGITEDCEFSIGSLADGARYTFIIVPYTNVDNEIIQAGYALNEISTYTLCKATQNVPKRYNSSKVKVSWKKVNGASGYEVVKLQKKNGKYVSVGSLRTTKTSVNISAKKKTTYYYKVRAYNTNAGKRVYAPWSSLKSYRL